MAQHIGQIVSGFPPGDPSALPSLENMLRRYADVLTPWAERTSARILEEANASDIANWRRMSSKISKELQRQIIDAPVGETFQQLQSDQVELIRSLPLEAAKRVHDLTIAGMEDSTRAKQIAEEILRTGEVTKSRAMLIARTETSRASANFMQARAQHAGSDGYVWRTSRDGDVRPSHRAMNGKLIRWDDPPTLDGMTGHAGCLPNCRCYPEPVLPDD